MAPVAKIGFDTDNWAHLSSHELSRSHQVAAAKEQSLAVGTVTVTAQASAQARGL